MNKVFELHSIGFNRKHKHTFVVDRPSGSKNFLFLHFLSMTVIELKGEKFIVEPGGCILYTPGIPQWYSSYNPIFANSYIHFDSLKIISLMGQYNIPANCIFFVNGGSFISEIFKEMESEFVLKDINWEQIVDGLMFKFLACLGRNLNINRVHKENPSAAKFYQQFRIARLEILNSFEKPWTLEEMAKLMNLCPSRFCIYYKKFFNISARTDLIHARIDRAKYLLVNQDHSVEEVASLTGYNNTFHFIRQFKTFTGVSPGKYRRQY